MKLQRLLAVMLAGFCLYSQGFACSWDYPIWPKSRKSDTPLFRFIKHDKAGYIDRQGKVVIPPQFDSVANNEGDFFNGRAQVFLQAESHFFHIDASGNRVEGVAGPFSEGLSTELFNGKWGFRDPAGNWVIPPEFDHAEDFSEGLAAVQVRGLYGYIDHSGKFAIAPQFGRAEAFHEGRASVIGNGPCIFVDPGPCGGFSPISIPAHGGPAGPSGRWGKCMYSLIDRTGKVVLRDKYLYIGEFSEGLAPVSDGDKWGYIDTSGRIRIGLQYEGAQHFSEGLAAVRWGGSTGFIDQTGQIVIKPQYEGTDGFSEGVAMVVDENRRASFIDRKGNRAVPGEFDAASSFVMGLAHVRLGKEWPSSEWLYIDKTGKAIFRYRENSR